MALITHLDPDRTASHEAGFNYLASLGKRVLRPGGVELTRRILDDLCIGPDDDVLELAPGFGRTTQLLLDHEPASYVAVDRDPASQQAVEALLRDPSQRFRRGSITRTGLTSATRDVGVGEAVLTMQPAAVKERAIAELARVVRPGGRIGLHEVAYKLDDLDHTAERDDVEEVRIAAELRSQFHVTFTPLTIAEWRGLLAAHHFTLHTVHRAPLRLLEPERLIADEGVAGAARFGLRLLRDPEARYRVTAMRAAMHRNAAHLRAVGLVARRDD